MFLEIWFGKVGDTSKFGEVDPPPKETKNRKEREWEGQVIHSSQLS